MNTIYKTMLVKAGTIEYGQCKDPKSAGTIACAMIGLQPQESMIAIFLNTHLDVCGTIVVSTGTHRQSTASPADVFRGAILHNADRIIIAHNHPSGNLEPSIADLATTKKLLDAGGYIGIQIVDHLIVFGGESYSIRHSHPEIFQ